MFFDLILRIQLLRCSGVILSAISHFNFQLSTVNYQLPLFLRHIFPIPSGHVIQLLLRIHAFADTNSLEVSAPEILEEFVILTQHLVIEFAIVEVEGQRILILERDARHLLLVVVEAISALGIVEEPGLGTKAVLEVMHHQRQHIVSGDTTPKYVPSFAF